MRVGRWTLAPDDLEAIALLMTCGLHRGLHDVCLCACWQADLEANAPYKVFALRSMLAVPYFEKALYELPDDQVIPSLTS